MCRAHLYTERVGVGAGRQDDGNTALFAALVVSGHVDDRAARADAAASNAKGGG